MSSRPDQPARRRRDDFEALALPLLPSLAGMARCLLRDESSVPALVQETLLRAYQAGTGPPPGTRSKAWLLTILYSVFDASYRKGSGERGTTSIEDYEARFDRSLEAPDPEVDRAILEDPNRSWSRSAVSEAFDRLPEPYRTAVLLVDIEQLSCEEAATILACAVDTLRSRLFRGRHALATELALLDAARGAARGAAPIAAREHLAATHAPPGLETRVRAALDREDEVREAFDARGRRRLPRAVWAAGWVLSVALAVVLIFAWTIVDAPAESARDFRALSRGQLALSLKTGDPARLQRRLAEEGLGFPPHVLDLEALGWQLAGGRVHRFARRSSALIAYEDSRGRWLVSQVFAGKVDELPDGAERRTREGVEFLVYERDGVTSVFWQEGAVVCVLASDLPRVEVVQLAFAGAMKTV